MTFHIVRAADARHTATPAAEFTTLASPEVSGTERTTLFTMHLQAGAAGPMHTIDAEQIWHVLAGDVRAEIDGSAIRLDAGDTVRVSGGASRQVIADTDATLLVTCPSSALAQAASGTAAVSPPWLA